MVCLAPEVLSLLTNKRSWEEIHLKPIENLKMENKILISQANSEHSEKASCCGRSASYTSVYTNSNSKSQMFYIFEASRHVEGDLRNLI